MSSKRSPSPIENLLPQMVGGRVSEMATYSDLFNNTPDPIFLLDGETLRVVDHNSPARSLLGKEDGPVDGAHFPDWVHPDSRAALDERLAALRTRSKVVPPFDCFFLGSGSVPLTLELSACRLKLADYCDVIQIIGKDVTKARDDAAELARISRTDAMTGLYNFRALKDRMAEENERSRRHGRCYSVILCDIDHFKKYNDQNGHPEGDQALRTTARILQTRARLTDFTARYGGEEFVVLCAETTGEQARKFAESLRTCVEDESFEHGATQPLGKVTISLGVAEYPRDGQTPEEVLKAADEALYQSKANGRNRVTLFSSGQKNNQKSNQKSKKSA